jgi:hypothetical protein
VHLALKLGKLTSRVGGGYTFFASFLEDLVRKMKPKIVLPKIVVQEVKPAPRPISPLTGEPASVMLKLDLFLQNELQSLDQTAKTDKEVRPMKPCLPEWFPVYDLNRHLIDLRL